tara:strand:+ start:1403 stop:1957 length:555 start_codon:yes stop_codon:yes gene_type:complete
MNIYKTTEGKRIHDQTGVYFLTFTVINWIDIFSRRELREVITDSLNYCSLNKGLIIHAYVIMSNHIHLVCKTEHGNLSDVIRDFKRHTSKEIIKTINTTKESRRDWILWMFSRTGEKATKSGYKVWKGGSGAEEIITNKFLDQKVNYIHQNPVSAGIVNEDFHYVYSSAGDYCGGKGLVDIIVV